MIYNHLRFPCGKAKAVTLSYDDGRAEDKKLLEIINRYGIKCTFNLCGNKIEQQRNLTTDYIKEHILAKGHEIANHGFYHRGMDTLRPIEGIRDTLDNRLRLEQEFGIIVRGMAYPDRAIDQFSKPVAFETVKSYLKELGIVYARSAGGDNDKFELPDDWYQWLPSAHNLNPLVMDYIDKFISLDNQNCYRSRRGPKLFYMWGHSTEFEKKQSWEFLEEICRKLGNREEIWYATNIEIYDYVEAYRSLVYSADNTIVYNPTLFEIWFDVDGTLYHIKPGETLRIEE